ncbi:hypothetical protein WR25_16179 [Diploscapter pachys]|uniref:RING-type E3 ubiquitin transferase n=1 Tax=Diploscapter pachys TaxID=2018661 RepID=A0A2A2KTY4_9BILA|nr:hypothetical protein WR25_16179 [Diploscapter pachys]
MSTHMEPTEDGHISGTALGCNEEKKAGPPIERLQTTLAGATCSSRKITPSSPSNTENGRSIKRPRLSPSPTANSKPDQPKSKSLKPSNSVEEVGEEVVQNGVNKNRNETDEQKPETSSSKAVEDEQKCAICLGSYVEHDETKLDGCSHRFCFNCINEWIKITPFCPLCKAPTQILTHRMDEEPNQVLSVRDALAQAEAERLANRAQQRGDAMIEERNAISRRIRSIRETLGRMNLDQQMNLEREQRGSNRHLHRKAKASSANDKRKERDFRHLQRQHQTLVTEMNALEILRDSVNNLQVTRQALIGNSLFRRIIYEENLRWSEVGREQNDMNHNRVPFTPQISIDERERHEPRIREWTQRELRVIFYNPSEHVAVDEQMLRKLSADIYSMTQNYPINAPQFSSFLREEVHMPVQFIDQFQSQLFEFASSNLPIEAHDANSHFVCTPSQSIYSRLPGYLAHIHRIRGMPNPNGPEVIATNSSGADDDVQVVAEVRTIDDDEPSSSRRQTGTSGSDDSDQDFYARRPLRFNPPPLSSTSTLPSSSASNSQLPGFRNLFGDFFNLPLNPPNNFLSFDQDLSNLIHQIRMRRADQDRMLRCEPPRLPFFLPHRRRHVSTPPPSSSSRRRERSAHRERPGPSRPADNTIVLLSDDDDDSDVISVEYNFDSSNPPTQSGSNSNSNAPPEVEVEQVYGPCPPPSDNPTTQRQRQRQRPSPRPAENNDVHDVSSDDDDFAVI